MNIAHENTAVLSLVGRSLGTAARMPNLSVIVLPATCVLPAAILALITGGELRNNYSSTAWMMTFFLLENEVYLSGFKIKTDRRDNGPFRAGVQLTGWGVLSRFLLLILSFAIATAVFFLLHMNIPAQPRSPINPVHVSGYDALVPAAFWFSFALLLAIVPFLYIEQALGDKVNLQRAWLCSHGHRLKVMFAALLFLSPIPIASYVAHVWLGRLSVSGVFLYHFVEALCLLLTLTALALAYKDAYPERIEEFRRVAAEKMEKTA